MRQLRRKLHRGKYLRIFCVKSWSLATLILTAVSSIVSSHSYCFKMTSFTQVFYISHAVWAFQCSNRIMYHLIMKCNQKRKKNIYFYQAISSLYRWKYIQKSVLILACEFVCLLTIIMDISYLNMSINPVLLGQWMILLLCRAACFLLHKYQKVLHVFLTKYSAF